MWFVSSPKDGDSYEDPDLKGGIFTHYFLEAMEKADTDGPGITLHRMWEYASAHTEAHTEEKGHPQEPELISELRTNTLLEFSFP